LALSGEPIGLLRARTCAKDTRGITVASAAVFHSSKGGVQMGNREEIQTCVVGDPASVL
jgi:hypothetical protein